MNVSKEGVRQKLHHSRETLVTLFAGALSIMFTQQLVAYLNDKLREWNILGVDSQLWALLFTGSVLVLLIWFGVLKPKS